MGDLDNTLNIMKNKPYRKQTEKKVKEDQCSDLQSFINTRQYSSIETLPNVNNEREKNW
jgi:hypothetical protein